MGLVPGAVEIFEPGVSDGLIDRAERVILIDVSFGDLRLSTPDEVAEAFTASRRMRRMRRMIDAGGRDPVAEFAGVALTLRAGGLL